MMINRSITLLFTLMFFIVSCEQVAVGTREITSQDINGGVGGDFNGDGVVSNDNGSINNSNETVSSKVELRHIIEPQVDDDSNAGKYTRKLTLPKNYNGLLYIAGINISSLASKNLRVRFKFGLNSSPITIPATISIGAGITPQTNVEVLVLDLRNRPFNNIQLPYDLYDYNDYEF
jgi:hypothetical protein